VAQLDVKKMPTAGASIDDKEFQRQRERETQLRAERELLATASMLSPSSPLAVSPTPSGGGFVDRRPAKVIDAERLSKRRTFDGESSLVHEMDEQRQREEELRQQRASSNAVNGYADGRTPAGHVINQARGADRQSTRVRPLEDPDDDDDNDGAAGARLSLFTPRNDTLIEREIRITRQREGSLRRVRGYPAIIQQTAVEVPLSGFGRQLQAQSQPATSISPRTSPRAAGNVDDQSAGSVNDDVAMRRLATNRLRQEILRERKREVDLRTQGKIYTISEEHIERPPLLAEMVAASAETSPRTPSPRVDNSELKDSAAINVVNSDGRHQFLAAARHHQQHQQQHNRAPPHDETGRRRLVGEKLIEQEVRELRRREQELRSADKNLSQS